MGGRDHSAACPACGQDRGGLNDLECDCDQYRAGVAAGLELAARRVDAAPDGAYLDELAAAVRALPTTNRGT